jgi:26S proteasome regulatory subunit N7
VAMNQIIESPEIIAILPTVPTLVDYCDSLYKCEYSKFFKSLGTLSLRMI